MDATISVKRHFESLFYHVSKYPYESFFVLLAVLIVSPFSTVIAAILLLDEIMPIWLNAIVPYVSLLVVLAAMLQTTAKDLLRLWIVFSVVFTALPCLGLVEIKFIQWLFF